MSNRKQIVVTGSSGFLGRHTMPVLRARFGEENVTGLTSADYDLTDPAQVSRMFDERKPDILVHLAGYVGGIGANREWPATFYHRNIMMTSLAFDAAARYHVAKLVFPMGGCSYPGRALSPIGEDQMWDGYPQPESAPYSLAKKMGLVASHAYRREFGLNSVVVIPGNMYGEFDNFRYKESHVVPALIRRFYEAKLRGDREVVVWGTGRATRDFVYAGDVAALAPFFIEQYDTSEPVNLSSGVSTPIRELAETIRELTGFPGELVWDTSKPDGQIEKIFDVSRMRSLGLSCPTSLRAGLERTIEWFMRNYAERSDGLRL